MDRVLEKVGEAHTYRPRLLITALVSFLGYCFYKYLQIRRERTVR